MKLSRQKLSRLYEADETAWLEEMSRLIKGREYAKLDYRHLREYLEDMAKRDRREVMSRLTTLLTHLLKWDYQPRRRSRSWEITILTQRHDLQELLDSQTLMNHAREILAKSYAKAVQRAAAETRLKEDTFPGECPYTLDQVLSTD
jgi:hypothetical protein